MNEKQKAMYEVLCELSGEQVVNILTDWHGMQLLSDNLYDEMVDNDIISS